MDGSKITKAVSVIGALASLVAPISKLYEAISDQIEEGHRRRAKRRAERRAARAEQAAAR
jgi:hypothetical protein